MSVVVQEVWVQFILCGTLGYRKCDLCLLLPLSLGYGMDVASWLSAGVVGQPRRDPVSGQILGSNRTSSDITTNVHYVT